MGSRKIRGGRPVTTNMSAANMPVHQVRKLSDCQVHCRLKPSFDNWDVIQPAVRKTGVPPVSRR